MRERLEAAGRRFARFATTTAVARPRLWRVLRPLVRRQFDSLASVWESRMGPEGLLPLEAALERLASPPRKALDLGTGTGKAARVIARRFPEAEVVGADLSPEMISAAERLLPPDVAGRIRFEVADGAQLPFGDAEFDLVVLQNAIPFFEELARVLARDGTAVFAFTRGAETPIWVPPETLRRRLAEVGLDRVEEVAAGNGGAFLAARSNPG
ncbi:MAG: class I SAM-dependent methyltransferase [Gaiellaceae bacterium]